jgi:hypothetical protein
MAMLPVVMVLTKEGMEGGRREMVLAGVCAGGLGLVHYRVLVFYGCWVVVELVSGWRRGREGWKRVVGIGGMAVLLTLPWWLRLLAVQVAQGSLFPHLPLEATYYALPYDLLAVPHNRWLAILAVWGLLWGWLRGERAVAAMGLWVAFLFLVANPGWLGLPHTPLINHSALVISLFLPMAVLVGYLVSSLYRLIVPRLGGWHGVARYGMGLLIVLVALWGAWEMRSIVNPVTVLATQEDMEAMAWIRERTSQEAIFLINARPWQGGIYVGSDGGYWILLLTGRRTTLPPALYVFGPPEVVEEVNGWARMAASGAPLDGEMARRLLSEGVTHIYLGAQGGSLNSEALQASPYYRLVYARGAVRIFDIVAGELRTDGDGGGVDHRNNGACCTLF